MIKRTPPKKYIGRLAGKRVYVSKPIEKEVLVALYRGEVKAWFGGDGNMVQVWENDKIGRKESKMFLIHNKYHRPKIVKAKITIL